MTFEDVFATVLRVPAAKITDDSSPATLKKWDSFNHLRLIVALEDEYKVKFTPAEIGEMQSVAKVKVALRRKGVVLGVQGESS